LSKDLNMLGDVIAQDATRINTKEIIYY